MIIEKHKPLEPQDEEIKVPEFENDSEELELYDINPLCEAFKAIKNILGDLKSDPNNPNSPPLFRTIKLNNGQVNRLKNNKWNKEYAIAFPAAFIHFIDVNYLVLQSRIGEGRAVVRIQYVLNRLNNSDADFELEGFEMFQRINTAIQERKNEFSALTERFQLKYFDQPESFDDALQPFWIDYEIWFRDHSAYRYKNYIERYIVIPPFTNHSDQNAESNPDEHSNHLNPTIEDVAGFTQVAEEGSANHRGVTIIPVDSIDDTNNL